MAVLTRELEIIGGAESWMQNVSVFGENKKSHLGYIDFKVLWDTKEKV